MPKPTVTVYLKRLEAAGFCAARSMRPICGATGSCSRRRGARSPRDGLALLSDEFDERLGRLSAAQQKELKHLLEKIL